MIERVGFLNHCENIRGYSGGRRVVAVTGAGGIGVGGWERVDGTKREKL